LRVCFISSYPPNRARLSEYAQSLVTALSSEDSIESLDLLVDKTDFQNHIPLASSKVKLYRVWKADSPLSILNLMLHIVKRKPDVVHFNISFQSFGSSKFTNFFGLSLIFLSKVFGFRVLAAVHTLADPADLPKYQLKPTIVNKVGIMVGTKMIISAQSVVVLVKTYADSLKERYNHRGVHYIPHGTAVDEQSKALSKEKVILLFGHMGPHKGLPVLLKAFEKIRASTPNVKLLIAGTNHPNFPNYLQKFMKAHIPNVEFTGYVPKESLGSVFRRATVVVLPYHAAPGTSGVFHLACGYSRPVVASDLPEIREIVNDGASAILVPAGDDEALQKAILSVLSDEGLASKMGEQNLKFAQTESWSAVARAYTDLYQSMLASE
jgi:glycosyltransferase involved in cell wall biosynthesis